MCNSEYSLSLRIFANIRHTIKQYLQTDNSSQKASGRPTRCTYLEPYSNNTGNIKGKLSDHAVNSGWSDGLAESSWVFNTTTDDECGVGSHGGDEHQRVVRGILFGTATDLASEYP